MNNRRLIIRAINSGFLARIGLVSIINTLVGISIFPILKTILHNQNNAILMSASYVICIVLSFCLHGKISFRSSLTPSRFVAFFIVNLSSLLIMIFSVSSLAEALNYDIRIIQPAVAVILQIAVVFLYQHIFWKKDD